MKCAYTEPGGNWHHFGASDWLKNFQMQPAGLWSVCVADMGLLSFFVAVVDDFGDLVPVLA